MDLKDYINGRQLVMTAIDNSVLTADEVVKAKTWVAQLEKMLVSGDISIQEAVNAMQETVQVVQSRCGYNLQEVLKNEQLYSDFMANVVKTRTCWFYPCERIDLTRYGLGTSIAVTRYIFQATYGAISDHVKVQRTCKNPRCCNPKHARTAGV